MSHRNKSVVLSLLASFVVLLVLLGVGELIFANGADEPIVRATPENPENTALATLAGGCFWCMEPPFDELEGVISTISGFTGGHLENPTYQQVVRGRTGHAEAVQIVYDPEIISYPRLLNVFWRNIDPTVVDRQFCDSGNQYRTAIFVHGGEQRRIAEESKKSLVAGGRLDRVETQIVEAGPFFPAEEYHQDYYRKNPIRYKTYRLGCGRDARLDQLWGVR